MKKALIIGISGQDGAYLAEFLLKKDYFIIGTSRDHEVSGFGNLKILGIKEKITLVSMVTSDFRSVISIFHKYKPDEIYNLAGQTSVGLSFEYPVETFESILIGTMNLLECIRMLDYPTKFYNAGSGEIFGNTAMPANELTPLNPLSPYATAKAAAYYAVANYRNAYGLFACTGILFNHESLLRPERFVTKKITKSVIRIANGSNERLSLGRIKISRDWGWAPDYVEAMWLMLNKNKPDDYVIATGVEHTLEDFLNLCFSYFGMNWKDHVDVNSSLFRPLDIERSYGDPSKAYNDLGWKSKTKFDELIARLLK
jgi:GDPmannose 4,6-dehydratase